ncbi:kyphoscoliosis peptidase [Microcaecilia unicolor]|uniref:Kyphoscoliosis peptidase n=1 Tax=Microcaecilia unicolor TaxID=1415580 RepID=A0A6P7ZA69_9AMPH|nr:kyphoscoliosis peptidase [Microcaecilia unicolor]
MEQGRTDQMDEQQNFHESHNTGVNVKEGRAGQRMKKDSIELHRKRGFEGKKESIIDHEKPAEQGGHVTFEIQPKNNTPQFLKKLSFGKGKSKTTVTGRDNKGFQVDNDAIHQQKLEKGIYAYPWDRTNLKSLSIDLKKLEKLDGYASKVDVTSSIEDLVKVLLKEANTDLEKVRAIWMWICHHIEYDVIGYKNTANALTSPIDVLQSRKSICEGYAGLFERMCSIAGIECIKLSGYAKGYGYKVGQNFSGDSDHAWNAVFLEGSWHLLDSTWGAGHCNNNCTQFTFKYEEYYFLTHPALFIGKHFPEDKKWQLLQPTVSLKQYETDITCGPGFYNAGLLSAHPETAIIKTADGKATVSIEGHSQTLFIFNLNGTEKSGLMTLQDNGMKLEVYPQVTGNHELQIYAKPYSSNGSYDFVLSYIIKCNSVNRSIKFPKDFINPLGPSWLTEKKGLLEPSHVEPIIHTEDGRCAISFKLNTHLSTMAELHSENITVTEDTKRRHIFQAHWENRVEFKVQLPQAGTYVLQIYAKNKSDHGMYDFVCNYLLCCTNASVKWPVFPLSYSSWMEDYELVEPLAGVLPANSNVHFKLRAPGVDAMYVDDKRSSPLTLCDNGYWQGTCNTTGCQTLHIYAKKRLTNSYSALLQYKVKT